MLHWPWQKYIGSLFAVLFCHSVRVERWIAQFSLYTADRAVSRTTWNVHTELSLFVVNCAWVTQHGILRATLVYPLASKVNACNFRRYAQKCIETSTTTISRCSRWMFYSRACTYWRHFMCHILSYGSLTFTKRPSGFFCLCHRHTFLLHQHASLMMALSLCSAVWSSLFVVAILLEND